MKIGFVVTTHYSELLRKNGRILLKKYVKSLNDNCNYNYKIFIVDNGSSSVLEDDYYNNETIDYTFIENQSISGITGAWNLGISKCIKDGCDIIINTNDDIVFNESINNMIKVIKNHKQKDTSIYGPVTNVGGCPGPNKQERDKIGERVLEVTEVSPKSWNGGHGINGFFNAFTKECYHKFEKMGNLYSTEKKYMIDGQESEMQVRLGKIGLKSFIVESCMVNHTKIRGWLQLK
jgi:GT2 family glycosyltransferase